MAPEAISRRHLAAGPPARLATALRAQVAPAAWRAFWTSRALVLATAVVAALVYDVTGTENQLAFDVPSVTAPIGGLGETFLTPLARWDAVWYLGIAANGYTGEGPETAFFPLYPLLVSAAAGFTSSHGALLIASYAVSLAAFLGALALLHRLVALELGERAARSTLLLLAFFPGAIYFGAPYSESVFLLVSVGAFYAARTGHWAWAGVLAALASGTRSAGIVLLVPLVLMYLRDGERSGADSERRRADILWLALAPAGVAAYSGYLELEHGDAFAFLHLQEAWFRHFAGPFGAVWDGAVAGWDGVRQLASGSRDRVYFEQAADDPFRVAVHNLVLFGFLVFALAGAWGVLRRLPLPYGAYVVVALALPLSFPVTPQPLMSLPRFLSVLFPLFMWLALVCEERRMLRPVLAVSAALLVVATALFAAWEWVA
jgi:hypothetical protein